MKVERCKGFKDLSPGEMENFRIGAAVSDSATGPYRDLYDRPMFDPGYPVIDGNLLFEGDRIYLYYSRCCNLYPSNRHHWAYYSE